MKKSTRTDNAPASIWPAMGNFDVAKLTGVNGVSLKAMAELQEHCIGRVAKINREFAAFVDRRLQHDQKTVHELAGCETPQQVMRVWEEYFDTASRHYQDEMSTFARLGIDQTQETIGEVQHSVEDSASALSDEKKKTGEKRA